MLLLHTTNRKSHAAGRLAPFPMTLSGLQGHSHVAIFRTIKAKFHYASWFGAGLQLVRAEIWPII